MKTTNWTLDIYDIENYTKEFSECAEKENGFGSPLFHMSNEPFSDNLFSYFKDKFSNMKQWKLPQGQFFTFGKKGEMELAGILHKSISEKKRLIEEMESALKELPESLPLPF